MTPIRNVAIIDDEADLRSSVSQFLELSEFAPMAFESAEQSLRALSPEFDGIVVSDIKMPGMDGMALLRRLQSIDPGLPVILMTGHGDVPMAVEAMRIGAFDFIEKPFDPEKLLDLCMRAAEARKKTLESRDLRRELGDSEATLRRLVGQSPGIERIRSSLPDVAQADGHVLILGETGTGKSLIASALHACGPHGSRPLVTMNCAAVSHDLLEGILFGGPDFPEKPLIEQAEDGTLCLENVEALPEPLQIRLLDSLNAAGQASTGQRPISLKLISTSSTLTSGAAPAAGLRDDFFFRLAGLVLEVPPLRARGEDVLVLFNHYAQLFSEEYGYTAPQLDAADAANMMQAPWPGNVRQLINLAERAVLQASRGDTNISALLIDDGFQAPVSQLDAEKPLKEHVEAFEKMLIDNALRRHHGSVASVMTELALPRRTLNEKMAKYGLSRQNYL